MLEGLCDWTVKRNRVAGVEYDPRGGWLKYRHVLEGLRDWTVKRNRMAGVEYDPQGGWLKYPHVLEGLRDWRNVRVAGRLLKVRRVACVNFSVHDPISPTSLLRLHCRCDEV